MHEREKELRFSANRDSLTGLRNTTSYKSWVAEFNKEIVNGTAKVISDIFKRSPVFRIGGDEFLVILRHRDLEAWEKLFMQLDLECAKTFIDEKDEISISIARGFARFDPDRDLYFNDVFKRADNAMYEHKRKSKEDAV